MAAAGESVNSSAEGWELCCPTSSDILMYSCVIDWNTVTNTQRFSEECVCVRFMRMVLSNLRYRNGQQVQYGMYQYDL